MATTGTGTRQSSSDRKVQARRVGFEDALAEVPRHFAADGDLLLSHMGAALSAMFPEGEEFFIRTVRHYRDQITDPVLRRQVAGFIGQETTHGREHRVLNDRLAELGYVTKRVERATGRLLRLRERVASPQSNLAETVALEHLTATLAERLLSDPDARASLGHPAIRSLFLWHALEESEHKAVAFDVYRAVGGSERVRILTMKVVRYGFMGGLFAGTILSSLTDPASLRPGVLPRSLARFVRHTVFSRKVWNDLKAAEKPGFHPDDRDNEALVVMWREELFGPEGELRDSVAGTVT